MLKSRNDYRHILREERMHLESRMYLAVGVEQVYIHWTRPFLDQSPSSKDIRLGALANRVSFRLCLRCGIVPACSSVSVYYIADLYIVKESGCSRSGASCLPNARRKSIRCCSTICTHSYRGSSTSLSYGNDKCPAHIFIGQGTVILQAQEGFNNNFLRIHDDRTSKPPTLILM